MRYASSSDEYELWSSADENTDHHYDPGVREEFSPDPDTGDDPSNPPDPGTGGDKPDDKDEGDDGGDGQE